MTVTHASDLAETPRSALLPTVDRPCRDDGDARRLYAVSSTPPRPAVTPRFPVASASDRVARAVLLGVLDRNLGGSATLHDHAGSGTYGTEQPDHLGREPVHAEVVVHHPATYRRVLADGSVGLGESYAEGWWDADDLTAFLRLLERNVRRADPLLRTVHRVTAPVMDPLRRLRRPSRDRDRRNIHAHYDLGNGLFERMLDDTMMYSSAIFEKPTTSLAAASRAKLDRLCQQIELGPDDDVLEIGSGWGGFAVHAAEHYGCRVTTTTISQEQHQYATERVRTAGLSDRVTVLDRDYRDVEGRYDAIVSIEMIEAVDWREYDTFFRTCDRLLAPTGRMAVQAIVIPARRFDHAKQNQDFIKRVIFPGGCLPSTHALLSSATRASELDLVDLEDIGLHYGETLRRWRGNFAEMSTDQLSALGFDERFARLWEFYLCYCEAGFDEREISAVQLVWAGAGWRPRWRG